MIFDKRLYRNFDKTLIIAAITIFTIGILAIYSATQAKELPFQDSFYFRQLTWAAIGVVILFLIINVSYQRFIDMAYIIYGINIILLILVLFLGHIRLGAQRWFSVFGFAFQPSEFMKLSLVLAMSNYIGSKRGYMTSFENILVPCIIMGIPFALVLLQPDLGTALLLVPMFIFMLIIGGANIKYLYGLIFLGLAGLPFFWHFLRDYQKQRLMVFLNPNVDPLGAGYTIIQSKIAIGSGGLIGKGWLNGTQNQLNFLPERHTDFIFSVLGEEGGFFASMALLLLYFLIIKRILNVVSTTSDMYGKSIATGIAVMLSFQVIINIAMTIGLMPVVGIPLPLVSYGGSSLIMTLASLALVLNISMRRSTF